ncbi:MAG: alpha/beta hydrolase, partial [Lachnospiraceae bacterium]|nr:alpha/beta hydrolase [Lachnospiraceae bacterium]
MIIVRKIQIPGLPTQKPRRLYIYLPKEYEAPENAEKRYPVLYMYDGHNVFYDSHATYGR